jgi:hypothetical protein
MFSDNISVFYTKIRIFVAELNNQNKTQRKQKKE